MTQSEKQFKIREIDLQVESLLDQRRALEATPVTTYKVWEPDDNTKYVWYGQDGLEKPWRCCNSAKEALGTGMVHPAKEAAERHHSFLVMLQDLHKFAVEHNEGWKPEFAFDTDSFGIRLDHSVQRFDTVQQGYMQPSILPYFKSRSLAKKAIDTFGDRLKILFEYYNS